MENKKYKTEHWRSFFIINLAASKPWKCWDQRYHCWNRIENKYLVIIRSFKQQWIIFYLFDSQVMIFVSQHVWKSINLLYLFFSINYRWTREAIFWLSSWYASAYPPPSPISFSFTPVRIREKWPALSYPSGTAIPMIIYSLQSNRNPRRAV